MIADYIETVNSPKSKTRPLPSIPGVSSAKTPKFESPKKALVLPPKISESEDTKVVSVEELAQLLGGKRKLPKINTKIEQKPVSPIKEKSKSPKDKKNGNAKDKKYCATLDKSKITGERPAKGKTVYSLDEMKEIARNLKISPTGIKQVLADNILARMKEIGC
jgi:hypothetical protein